MIPPWIQGEIASLEAAHARRDLRLVDGPVGPVVRVDGRNVLCFSSNDYLGLAADPRLVQGARDAAAQWGSGSGASRLVTGTLAFHERLEARLAAFKGAETALLFGTGYQANVGVLQGLMSEGAIFSDQLNHASIVDGCRLARATVHVYAHCDMQDLERKLHKQASAPRKMIVTDGVFSMDGDVAPLDHIVELARRFEAIVLVDDAHATGVIGHGKGTAHHFGLDPTDLIQMGTMGKALGSFGAFVACPTSVRDLLVTRARSFVYTTAPPPSVVGASAAALRIIQTDSECVQRLAANAKYLRAAMRAKGFAVGSNPTPITPVVLGSNERALRWAAWLWDQGVWVQPIRPPTVPQDTARLRITVSARHEPRHIDTLCEALGELAASEEAQA